MSVPRRVFLEVSGGALRHALAYAVTLRRRCVVNKEPSHRAAKRLGLDCRQTMGVVRLLSSISYTPTCERMAVIAQLDPGLDDDDIGEIFGRTPEWSAEVREKAAEIRRQEPIPEQLEWLTEDLQPGDLAPEEIAARAEEVRRARVLTNHPTARSGIRKYRWSPRNATFVFQSSR